MDTKDKKCQVDPKLHNGPIADDERSCTDLFFCILWIAFSVVMAAIMITGFVKGHPDRLLVAYDADGRACGLNETVKDYPYIYLGLPWVGYFNRSVCVSECPTWPEKGNKPATLKCKANRIVQSCDEMYGGIKASADNNTQTFFTKFSSLNRDYLSQTTLIYNSTGIWKRLCIPADANFIQNTNFSKILNMNELEKYFSDVKNSWAVILVACFGAFVIGLVYMILLRYCSGIFVWIAIFGYFAALILLGIFLKRKSEQKENDMRNTQDPDLKKQMEDDSNNLKYISYLIWAILAASFIGLLCLYKSIQMAIAIIKCATLFVAQTWSVMLVPPVITVCLLLWGALWLVVFVFVYSIGDITGSSDGSPFASVKWEKNTRNMLWVWLFGGLWTNAFILAVNQFVLASTTSIWYFSDKDKGAHAPVRRSVYRAFRYHLGSLAFGAFLLAVVQFIRIVLAYIKKQLQASGQSQNKAVKCIIDCLQCFMLCFQRFIEFLNKNAFIMISIKGQNFCSSARDVFSLIWSNPGKIALVSGIGQIYVFIGKLFISLVTGYIAYMVLSQAEPYQSLLFSPLLPTVFILIIAYVIGNMFMSVYGMGVDTILICALIDEEIMKVKNERPKYLPKPLEDFFSHIPEPAKQIPAQATDQKYKQ